MKSENLQKSVVRLGVVKTREKTAGYERFIRSSRCVSSFLAAAVWKHGEPASEEFWVVILNAKNRILATSLVARGSLTECPISPREVFLPAMLSGASSVILIHNHPSGDPSPSSEDRLLTIRMCEAGRLLGIKVLDHVIWAGEKYYSFRDDGVIG